MADRSTITSIALPLAALALAGCEPEAEEPLPEGVFVIPARGSATIPIECNIETGECVAGEPIAYDKDGNVVEGARR